MLNTKSLTIAALLAGVCALSFAQAVAPVGGTVAAGKPESATSKAKKGHKLKKAKADQPPVGK